MHDDGSTGCNCPTRIVSQKEFKATFTRLNHEEDYFPMVSRTDPQAFYGLPPKGLRPKAPHVTPSSRSAIAHRPVFNTDSRKAKGISDDDDSHWNGGRHENIYDASSSDEADMSNDPPARCPSTQSSLSDNDRSSDRIGNTRSTSSTAIITCSQKAISKEAHQLHVIFVILHFYTQPANLYSRSKTNHVKTSQQPRTSL